MMLKSAGALSASVGLLHLVIIFIGAPAYRYFGAGERMARMDERGSWAPAVITLGLATVFALWSAYAFSGAGVGRRLPLLRTSLILIGSVYTLRGLLLGPQLVWFFSGYRTAVPPRQLVFSSVSLLIGLSYLIGVSAAWAFLRPPPPFSRGA